MSLNSLIGEKEATFKLGKQISSRGAILKATDEGIECRYLVRQLIIFYSNPEQQIYAASHCKMSFYQLVEAECRQRS